jgi:PAS domain-containing protein
MEVARFRSQFFILLEQLSMQYRQAQQTLVNMRTQIGYKVRVAGKTVHARKYYLPELRSGGTAAIALTNKGIESIKPHISALLTKAAVVGQRTQENFVKPVVYKALGLGQAVHSRKYYWPELRRTGTAAIALTNRGIESIKPHISALLEKVALVGQRTQENFVKPVVYKALSLGQAVHAKRYYLPELQKGGAVVVAATSAGIANSTAYLAELSKRTSGHLWQAGQKVANTGREIASKPQRARDARKARENDLLNLMESSLDAIVVTDDAHRFVAANTNALQLFGVSYANIKNFTLDSFIANAQVAGFNGHSASKKGNCKIRRLDGKVRFAEYEFTANHVPFRHLCIFRSATIARTGTVRFQ